MQNNPKDIFYFLSLLMKWKKLLIINLLIVTVLAVIISLLLPPWYMATTTLIPPQNTGLSLLGGSGLLRDLSLGSSFTGIGDNFGTYNYFAILQSRTAMEKVINKFNLFDVYEISDTLLEDAIKELQGNTNFYFGDDNYIGIEVYDKNPKRAADMANYFVEVLNEMSLKLATEEATSNRMFIEKRYIQNLEDLKKAEDSLYIFQKQYGVVAIPEQVEISVKAAAEIEASLIGKEVAAHLFSEQYGEDSPQYKSLLSEINLLKAKINELKYAKKLSSPSNVLIPFSELPEISIQYLRTFWELKTQQTIMEIILPLYEQAKVEEQKKIPVILVLDEAIKPVKKAKPKRSLIVGAASLLSLLFSSVFIIGYDSYKNYKSRIAETA